MSAGELRIGAAPPHRWWTTFQGNRRNTACAHSVHGRRTRRFSCALGALCQAARREPLAERDGTVADLLDAGRLVATAAMDWKDAFAGAVSGVTTRFVVAPLDVVKIRLQLQVIAKSRHAEDRSRTRYHGILQSLRLIAREEGTRSLWKGNLAAELLWGGYMGTQFLIYRALQRVLVTGQEQSEIQEQGSFKSTDALCGGLAGGFATGMTYPFDLIRTRLAAQPEPKVYRGLLHAGTSIVEHEGARGLYRGLAPALIAVVPYMGIQFAVYEALKRRLHIRSGAKPGDSGGQGRGGDGGGVWGHLVCGCAAGCISKLLTLPLDVTKKRLQISSAPTEVRQRLQPSYIIQPCRGSAAAGARVGGLELGRSIMRTWAGIFSREGLAGFFRGGSPSVLKTALSSGSMSMHACASLCVLEDAKVGVRCRMSVSRLYASPENTLETDCRFPLSC